MGIDGFDFTPRWCHEAACCGLFAGGRGLCDIAVKLRAELGHTVFCEHLRWWYMVVFAQSLVERLGADGFASAFEPACLKDLAALGKRGGCDGVHGVCETERCTKEDHRFFFFNRLLESLGECLFTQPLAFEIEFLGSCIFAQRARKR